MPLDTEQPIARQSSASLAGHLLPELPPALSGLEELATDLRWTWSHSADALWEQLDPELWEQTSNPYVMLQNVSQQHLRRLAEDKDFCERLREVIEERQQYLNRCGWYGDNYPPEAIERIAFFSMEFGIGGALPCYAGGLGILSGDFLKAASDLCVPLVGVGLLYHQGYVRQALGANCWQQDVYPSYDPATLPVTPVYTDQGDWLQVAVELPGRQLLLRLWLARVGSVSLYLLDSNHPLNSSTDRGITGQLYSGGKELRLQQQLVLGIGGWRALEALGLSVDVCHLNEGHAAFVVLERTHRLAERTGLSFHEALWISRAGTLFTTHTPVAAAFDTYDPALIAQYAKAYAERLPVEELLALGRKNPTGSREPFNLAWFAMRGSLCVNGVSRGHGEISRRLFSDLYPHWPLAEVPVGHVTNGIHMPYWDSPWADRLWTESEGKERWRGGIEELGKAIEQVSDRELWDCRICERRDLIDYVRRRHARELGRRGATAEEIDAATRVLDPNVLTLGFARRFTAYKRPQLLLLDESRLCRLLHHPTQPLQIIVAGKAHPNDAEGKALVHAWAAFARRQEAGGRVVFLEDYDIPLAREMVQGVDLWLNTPRPDWEACGTSGMKVLVNGGLNLSVTDGWWREAYHSDYGWALDGDDDQQISKALFQLLEAEIAPAFYHHNDEGLPSAWVKRIRASMAALTPRFSSNRMLRDYIEDLYLDLAAHYRRRLADQGKLARELCQWFTTTRRYWRELRWGERRITTTDNGFTVEVEIYLDSLPSELVTVQLYADANGEQPRQCLTMEQRGSAAGAIDSYVYGVQVSSERPPQDFTPRLISYHQDALTPQENRLIFWWPREMAA